MPRTTRLAAVAALLVGALALAGCGGSAQAGSPAAPSGPATTAAAPGATPGAASTGPSAGVPTGKKTADGRPIETFTDEVGRKVDIPVPAKSVVVGYNQYDVEIVRAVGAGDRIVGVSADGIADNPGSTKYWASIPGAGTIVGKAAEFNYDAVIAAKPELFVTLSNSPYQEAEKKLAPFGIPVLVVTAWDPKVYVQDAALLGEIFGTQQQAAKVVDLYTGVNKLLADRLAGVTPKTVYFENAKDFYTGVPGLGWNDINVQAGGKNIFDDIDFGADKGRQGTVHQTPIDPADVLERNPDVVLRIGLDGFPGTSYDPWPTDKVAALAHALASRPGWSQLTAVKNGDVFVVNNFYLSALAKEIGALALATWLHPDRFTGIDTAQYFKTWLADLQQTPYVDPSQYVYRLGGAQ